MKTNNFLIGSLVALATIVSVTGQLTVNFQVGQNEQVFGVNSEVFVCNNMLVNFRNNDEVGLFRLNGIEKVLLTEELFFVLCGPTEFFNVNNNFDVAVAVDNTVNEWLDNDDLDFIVDNVPALEWNVLTDRIALAIAAEDPDDINNLDIQDNANLFNTFNNLATTVAGNPGAAKAPGVFCVADTQCIGNRLQTQGDEETARICLDLGNGDAENGIIPTCNDFVAKFALTWLLVYILASYVILILWALYWTVPYLRKKCKGKKAGGGGGGRAAMNAQDQVLVNTLAAQCAASENMLLMATDFVKQAKAMAQVLSVEAKRESRIMIYLCEYFQAVTAIMTALTHEYIEKKTFTDGEKYNIEDCTTRALQLEVLNYVRTRIQLSLNADSMTEKSLIRLAEAYAICKKISESLVLVGFTIDRQFEDSLGTLRTPNVEFTEDALFLGGIWKSSSNAPGMNQYENSPVCIVMNDADTRNLQRVGANMYLTNSQKDAKNYNPTMMMTQPTVGKSLAFNSVNAGQNGEGSQYFVRTFWGPEIAAMQAESRQWVSKEGALEAFLDKERLEREQRAQPMVQQGSKPRRRRKKKKKKHNDQYSEAQDDETNYTEATETSGWAVAENNTYVYNVESVASHGLGIAGKASVPFDKPGEEPIKKGNKFFAIFETYFPNYAEWPKFYTFFFVVMPIVIAIPWAVKARQGAEAIDQDGNVDFKARAAGFGFSYLGVPNYYFLDAFVPEDADLVQVGGVAAAGVEAGNAVAIDFIGNALGVGDPGIVDRLLDYTPFDNNGIFISNEQAVQFFKNDWNGGSNRRPDVFIGEVQNGILAQANSDDLEDIRNMQRSLEISTMFLYGLMHIGAYFFGMVPLTLIRESLEILARKFPIVRSVYPMSQWRELHMSMGLAAILFVVFGSTVFLITQIVAINRKTPFTGLGGDPNIPTFFNMTDSVLYIRMILLPAVPLLLLMKYAARGPPKLLRKFAPKFITMNYWEICYFLHYFTALTAIIVLVIYRAQVFYWMGTTWFVVWGGNKIVRILRTRKATIKKADLISYTVEDSRNNAKKRSDVLRIELNIPSSFPSSARGQACWITCPTIDYVAHPFTLAKTPTDTDKTIMFHIAIRYLPGDDVISFAKPDSAPVKAVAAAPAVDANALPVNWKEAVDPSSGQTYYYNSIEQRTTWTRPVQSGADKLFDGVRGITSRLSAAFLKDNSVNLRDDVPDGNNARQFVVRERATWTQNFAALARKIQKYEPQLRANAVKNFPVYVSAPLGTSMDDAIKPDVPGSIIITTQNGLPAAESSVRWLLNQPSHKRPIFHFFVSVVREVNDALAVCEMLREAMVESVSKGLLNVDGLNGKHAHMADWLSVNINLTRRKGSTIHGDRDMLFRSLNEPRIQIDPKQLALIDLFIKSRILPGRLPFDRFLARTQQMVRKRAGDDRMVVAYCGSAKVANSIRSACRKLKNVKFDGEYI